MNSARTAYLKGRGWTAEQIAADRGRWAPDLQTVLTPDCRHIVVDYLTRWHPSAGGGPPAVAEPPESEWGVVPEPRRRRDGKPSGWDDPPSR
jgi:hypothetical protein